MGFGFFNGIDKDVINWASLMTVKPSGKYLYDLSIMVKKLKQTNIWSNLDRLWIFATEQQEHAQRDIRERRHLSLTEINSPTWNSLQGYTSNGTSSYLSLAYNPFNTGTQFWQQDSATFGYYLRTNVNENKNSGVVDASGNGLILGARNSVNQLAGRINSVSSGNITVSNSDSRGMFSINRSASNAQQLYKNGVSQGSNTAASTTIPNRGIFLLARNNNGTADIFMTTQVAMTFMGSSLNASKQLDIYNIFQEFAIKQGFNV